MRSGVKWRNSFVDVGDRMNERMVKDGWRTLLSGVEACGVRIVIEGKVEEGRKERERETRKRKGE